MLSTTWHYLVGHWSYVGQLTLEHIRIVFLANGLAVVIGLALGIFVSKRGREGLAELVLYVAGILLTVPSLALYGILMALLKALGLMSIGLVPVVVALTLYGLLPILRNTTTAIRGIDPAMIDAGRGMGMSEGQILWRVRIPLAVPAIMAGLRQAIVMNVGIAAIGAYIGAGGLGQLIFRGIANTRADLVLAGAICVSLLAVVLDVTLGAVERLSMPRGVRKEGQG
ncbi:MAG: ABC transporter permease [Thermotogota bacterium]